MRAAARSASSSGTARSGTPCLTGFRSCATWFARGSRQLRPRKARNSGTRSGTARRSQGILKKSSQLRATFFTATEWLPHVVARVPATIQAKLLVAFLATAVLLISLGAVGLQVLSGVNRRAQDLVKSQERIGAYRQFQHDTSLPASWSWNERSLEATLQHLNQYRYELDQLQVIAMDDADLLSRVRESYEQFLQAVGQVVELINARKAVDERKLHVKQASLLADRLERQTNELVNKAEANLMASIDSSQAAYTRSRWVVIGFALASIAMALVLGYAISWSLIGPVRLMDSRLRIVGSGDFSERVEVPNRDELGALAREFNRMATQLQDSYTKLTHSVEELTALGEIGQAVSSSLDLETVLNSIIARAVELSAARGGLIYEYDEAKQQFHLIRGSHRLDKELEE